MSRDAKTPSRAPAAVDPEDRADIRRAFLGPHRPGRARYPDDWAVTGLVG
ncbi:hypothetical protein GCM10010347_31700 [Streptomyces cirratus]|uniref:Uncharacterized protein n=1 Tax=Streptomyces cirratus TaxID=68187 RepID=A0ABQ3ETL2_9ACTN|nr:hypothetical protein [Streptomyces cirratus]GHB59410.1 hypothetical protein GCM10010347_31700 [Streptomyces cirratus]